MATKNTVLIFTTSYRPFVGGAEVAIEEITKRLSNAFDFFIITSRLKKELPKFEKSSTDTVVRVGWGYGFDKWFLPVLGFFAARKLIKKRKAIILGLDVSQGSLAAVLIKFLYPGNPFLLNIQYGYGEKRLHSGRLGMMRVAFRLMLKKTDFVTALSGYLLEISRRYGYAGEAEIIPNGVDIRGFENLDPPKINSSPVVITTSRLVSKNGLDILIRAIYEVKKEIPDTVCRIIGGGPEKEKLENEVRRLGLDANVKFLGEIPNRQISKYLHESDVFVRPSRSEGMGNSFVEAMAAGVPVIGTAVGGISDVIIDGQTGILAKTEDSQDLARKILLVLRDKKLSEDLSLRGLDFVKKKFDWNDIVKRYGGIFRDLSLKNKKKSLNILLATPLYPPQLGGPALYAYNLEREFRAMGHWVKTVCFGDYLKFPAGIRHLAYFLKLFSVRKADLVCSLDYFSVGLPAAVFSAFLDKPLIIRVEGDFIWEAHVEKFRKPITLNDFVGKAGNLGFKEKIISGVCDWVMKRADLLVFSSEWRRKMITDRYPIFFEKSRILKNVWPPIDESIRKERAKVILWAGRMLFLKNLTGLIRVFARINDGSYKLKLVGSGPERENLLRFIDNKSVKNVEIVSPLKHNDLLEELSQASLVILPSFSEVGPNIIAEAVSLKTPFLMTLESGYKEYIDGDFLFFNPLDENDLAGKIKFFMQNNHDFCEKYKQSLDRFNFFKNWIQAAKEWEELFYSISL